MRGLIRSAIAILILGLTAGIAAADALQPGKPVRIIVPLNPGSGADAVARMVAEELRPALGTPVIIDNQPGALGVIGTEAVAKSAPDGHTLILSLGATMAANTALVKNLGYHPLKDFTHLAHIASNAFVLVVGPAVTGNRVQDLVAQAKANPGRLAYGYGTTTTFVASFTLSKMAQIETTGVSYKSQPPALNDLIGGQTHFMFADFGLIQPHLKSGRLRALGVSSPKRSPQLPDVPTLEEQGFRNFDFGSWIGLSGPAGMPAGLVRQYNTEINRVIARPAMRERLIGLGLDTIPMTPAEFTAYIAAQEKMWGQRIREAGVQPQ